MSEIDFQEKMKQYAEPAPVGRIVEEVKAVPKDQIRLLYQKCLTCGHLCPKQDKLEKCSSNPECPAKTIEFIFGSDPRVFAEKVAELVFFAEKFPENSKVKSELKSALLKLKSRKDASTIMMDIASKVTAMGKEAEISDVAM
jgi:hypothetical protein